VPLAVIVLAACEANAPPKPAASAGIAPPPAEVALRVSDSVSVWFTSARVDSAADGTPCTERVMEIRAGARPIPIPLLYTREIPAIASDSTIEVHIWRHCVPADPYRVNLRTGQPTRIGG
jgi:hypothetical protein